MPSARPRDSSGNHGDSSRWQASGLGQAGRGTGRLSFGLTIWHNAPEAMPHLIPSHQARPSDDPIFALNKEATLRRERGEPVVNATVGALLDDDGKLAVLPTAARVVNEVPGVEWATYA